MDKTEYETINKLVDEGKLKELKEYLDERMDANYIKAARQAIMSLINSDCIKEHPSYYERVELHQGIIKTYLGLFEKTENGIVICHKDSNIFELYNEKILNSSLKDILKRTADFGDINEKKYKLESIKRALTSLDKKCQREIVYTSEEANNIEAWTSTVQTGSSYKDLSVIVPSNYYKIAHKLLGEKTEEYMYSKGDGLYLKSPKGKALIMRKNTK